MHTQTYRIPLGACGSATGFARGRHGGRAVVLLEVLVDDGDFAAATKSERSIDARARSQCTVSTDPGWP